MKKVLLLAAVLLAPVFTQAASTEWQTNPQGRIRLISSYDTAPQNSTILLGLHFQPTPGWYLYWKDPGEAGIPPAVKWDGTTGLKDPTLLWPQPIKIILPGDIEEYAYEGEMVYPIRAKVEGQTAVIKAKVSYLTCDTSCIPFTYTFDLRIPVGTTPVVDAEADGLIQSFLAEVPGPEVSDDQVKAEAVVYHKMPGQPINTKVHTDYLVVGGLGLMLLLAFVGGVLLNVMPCVLPVLGIKLAGLLQHSGQSKKAVVQSSLASAAGIIVSFLALAVAAILLRQAGHAVGWGIQFQNPVFVTFLLVVVLLFGFNLWGFFEIQMPRFLGHFASSFGYHESLSAHFTSGLFATLLATPCSAPFLGTALGFALAQPAYVILLIFGFAGMGLALPYFLLAVVPQSVHWLPRPGQWMITLKKSLAVLLFITAAWLGWVLYQQVSAGAPEHRSAGDDQGWMAFDETAIAGYLNEGKPVFVDVTADWCVTCKYNERVVLADRDVMAEFKRQGVVLMKADWTHQDPTIAAYLKKHGRAGIPFYAFYKPGQPTKVLSEFLTKSQVLKTLRA